MSTNTALDQIKARAEKAVDARLDCDNTQTDAQEEHLSVRAAFIAEQSSYDVPKLLAALEAVEQVAARQEREAIRLHGRADSGELSPEFTHRARSRAQALDLIVADLRSAIEGALR